MCLFKKNKKIDWPYLIFGLVALGIIISTVVLLFNLKTKVSLGLENKIDWTALKIAQEKHVTSDYLKSLADLKTKTVASKEADGGLKLAEEVFFKVHVPRQFLDQHLKAWLGISRIDGLDAGVRKETLIKILDQLMEEVKK